MSWRPIALAILAVVLGVLLVRSQWRVEPLNVSGYIEAHQVRLGSRVGGRVRTVNVEEGQHVKAGEPLVELEPFDLLARRAEAVAERAAREQSLARLEAGYRAEEIAQARARVDQQGARMEELVHGPRKEDIAAARARVQVGGAKLALARIIIDQVRSSHESGGSSKEELDKAAAQVEAAGGERDASQAVLDALVAGTRPELLAQARAQLEEANAAWALLNAGYRAEDIALAEAAVEAARAAVEAADAQLAELVVRASVDGVVEALDLRRGDLAGPNVPVVALLDTSGLWVRAYVPEKHLDLAVGRKVAVSVDAFPGRRFAAHISFIAREGQFTPRNVQTPEERSKQVFRIKVVLDEGLAELRPGMSADVWLD